MAVEIPVYVDIKGGIDRAVSEIPSEVKRLDQVLGKNALKLQFNIDSAGSKMSVQNLLTDTSVKAKELKFALAEIRKEFEAAMARNAGTKTVRAEVNNLIKAYTALEQRITGTHNTFRASMMSTENAIVRVKYKIDELRAKQAASVKGSDAWNTFGYEIVRQEDRLKKLNAQWELYRTKSRTAGQAAQSSISRTNTALTGQIGIWQRLTGLLSTYVSIFGLIRFVKQVRDVTGELEYQRVALQRLIQDEEYGAQLFERIKMAAKESPFRIKDLVTYTKQLAAYQIEQENLFDVTKRLADISAGLGVDMNRIILAYGQVRAASVLRGQELRQFTEAGIPLVELLAKKFSKLRDETVSTSEVFKLISERAVPFSMIAEIFEDLTEKGGMFYQMQEKQAQTLQGRWEKLKDAYDIALQSIGDTKTFQRLNDTVLKVLNGIAKYLVVIPKALSAITTSLVTYAAIKKVVNIVESRGIINAEKIARQQIYRAVLAKKLTVAEAAQAIQTELLAKAEAKLAAASTLTGRAYAKMLVGIVKNPWIAAAAAVAGLVMMLISFRKASEDTSKTLVDLDKTIEDYNQTLNEVGRHEKLIAEYERLAQKTDRTESETRELTKTMHDLQDIYPKVSLAIDDDTETLEANTKAMRENNEARLKISKERAEADLGLAKVQLEDLEKARDEIEQKYLNKRREMLLYDDEEGTRREMTKLEEKAYAKATEKAAEYREQLNKLDTDIAKTSKDIGRLEEYLGKTPGKTITAWQEQLKQMQLASNGAQLFTNEQLEGWNRLYDVSNDLEKEWKKLNEDLAALKASQDDIDPQFFDEWAEDIANLEAKIQGFELIRTFFGFVWGKDTSSKAHQKDPFITMMENRMKFMADFKKGYDDLNKYMSASNALEKESEIMLGRGLALNMDAKEQARAAENLSKWYEEKIDEISKKLRDLGLKGATATDLLGIDTSKRNQDIQDLQKLLQSLWDAKTDFDVSQMKDRLDKAFEKLSNEMKRSETIRNFYNNILDLTGDEDIAENITVSVYGGVGKDFKDRLQEQLYRALMDIQPEEIGEDLRDRLAGDITILDVEDIRKNLSQLPPMVRKMFEEALEADEQFNAEWLLDFEKTYAKAKTYQEQVESLQKQRTQKEREATSMGKTPEEVAAVTAFYNKKIAEVQLEAMKDSYTWTKTFEDLDGVSTQTLNHLIDLIDEYITKYRTELEPQQLKELTRAREQAENQIKTRDAYKSVIAAIKSYNNASKKKLVFENAFLDTGEDYIKILDEQQKAIKDLEDALSEIEAEFNAVASSTKNLMSVFASDDAASYFGSQLDNISQAVGGMKNATLGIAQLATGQITPQAIVQTLTGVADVVASIFGAANAAKLRRINKELKDQDLILENLEEAYGKLSDAMDKTFGNDYIYNYTQQLEILAAKQEAYMKQAQLERDKGKKSDEDKIREYEASAREAADNIVQLRDEVSSAFAGADLASAAESFADAWLSAYEEFGDTSVAIEERMTEMVKNIMKKAALSGIAQNILGGWYESLADVKDWNAETIATKWKEAMALVDPMVQGMQTFANSMQAEGVSLRNTAGQFTGISRDIAGASEESINGLAAGINTQNFYMSYISQNVAAILSYLTGGEITPASTATGAASDPYKDTVLLYMANLPQMRDDIASIRNLLSSVIKQKGTPAQSYVSTNL